MPTKTPAPTTKFQTVRISDLELDHCEGNDLTTDLSTSSQRYAVKHFALIKETILPLLLSTHPIITYKKTARSTRYQVIAGVRSRDIASYFGDSVNIVVLDKSPSPTEREQYRYIDQILTPLLFTLDGSSADWYQLIMKHTEGHDFWKSTAVRAIADSLKLSHGTLVKSGPRNEASKGKISQKKGSET